MLYRIFFLLFLLTFVNISIADDNTIAEYLQSISVRVKVNNVSGSGIAFTRKDWTGTNNVTFIWTASHLFCHKDDVFDFIIFNQSGTNAPLIYHAQIQQEIIKDGKFIGITNKLARLIKFSGDEMGEDLALLQVEGPYYNTNTVVFDLSGKIPKLGTSLYCIGSPFGFANSFSTGLISGIGRILDQSNHFIYDQTTCVVFPGSSGGGIFTTNKMYIGMTTVMSAPNINFSIPVRRMQEWVKKEHIEWALDPTIPMPCEPDFKSIKLLDIVDVKTNTPPNIIVISPNKHQAPPTLKSPKITP